MTGKDELQAAADRGDLDRGRRTLNEQQQRNADLSEKRWVILQAIEVAKHIDTTPEQFRGLCEFIQKFVG